MVNFLNKPQIKNILLAIPGLIIGALCSALGSWDNRNTAFWIKVICALLWLVLYIALLIFYSTNEVNERRIKKLLEEQIKAYEEVMIGIDNICKECSSGVNAAIHEILEEGKYKYKIWNFDKASMLICSQLYSLLVQLSGGSKDFGIAYIKLEENEKPEINIRMCGFANQNMHKPSIYGKPRPFNNDDDRNYHDTDLFKTGKSDIEIIIGSDKIDEVFSYATKKSRNANKEKYNQYIAIPVFCDDVKMVGLLEIVCFNDTALATTDKELMELASKYFVPYSYLMLLLHKMEKALLARPKGI